MFNSPQDWRCSRSWCRSWWCRWRCWSSKRSPCSCCNSPCSTIRFCPPGPGRFSSCSCKGCAERLWVSDKHVRRPSVARATYTHNIRTRRFRGQYYVRRRETDHVFRDMFGYIAGVHKRYVHIPRARVVWTVPFTSNRFAAGIMWPLEGMHPLLKNITFFFPLTMSVDAFRSMTSRNWTLSHPKVNQGFVSILSWIVIAVLISMLSLKFKQGIKAKK